MASLMKELYLRGFRFVSLLQRHAWIGLSTIWTATLEILSITLVLEFETSVHLIFCMDLVSPTTTSTIVVATCTIFR